MMKLNELKLNEEAIIMKVDANSKIKQRLTDIGFVKGEKVKPILKNLGDSMRAYKIKKTVIALRLSDTKEIYVKKVP